MKNNKNKRHKKVILSQVDGIGVIEIILILVIIIGLVLIFRNQIEAILQTAFESINTNSDSINSGITIN
jgi:hypothetical protein